MSTIIDNQKVAISPVDMQERKELGIRTGDTVRVWQKIEEKGKTRLQAFEGVVLATKHGTEPGATFTVRKVASGVGVEKVFPLFSPMIDKLEIVKRVRVRRSKLYILRDKVAREMKRVLRRGEQVAIATKGTAELEEERKLAEAKQKEIDEAQVKLEAEEAAKKEAKEKATVEAEEKAKAGSASPEATQDDSKESKEETKTEEKPDDTKADTKEDKDVSPEDSTK